jgi:hypothetical protein
MATYRIIDVTRFKTHNHIQTVTYRKDTRTNLQEKQIDTVSAVRQMIVNGDRFYTFGKKSLKNAEIEPWSEKVDGVTINTIRSKADRTTDNNLDNL